MGHILISEMLKREKKMCVLAPLMVLVTNACPFRKTTYFYHSGGGQSRSWGGAAISSMRSQESSRLPRTWGPVGSKPCSSSPPHLPLWGGKGRYEIKCSESYRTGSVEGGTAHWPGTRAFSKRSKGEQSISSTGDWAGATRGSDSSFCAPGCRSLGSANPLRRPSHAVALEGKTSKRLNILKEARGFPGREYKGRCIHEGAFEM